MDAFRKLTAEIGEEAMLSLCYEFMTFCVARPTEEQRLILETKFAQDRYFEELRTILTRPAPEAEAPAAEAEAPAPEAEAEAPSPRPSFQEPVAISPKPQPQTQRAPKKAEKWWPFMRVKNFVKHLGLAEGRFSHMKGLEILAAHKGISVEELLDTRPESLVSHSDMKRLV